MIDWERTAHYLEGIKMLHLRYCQVELLGLDHNDYQSYVSPQGQFWMVPWDDERLKEIREKQKA